MPPGLLSGVTVTAAVLLPNPCLPCSQPPHIGEHSHFLPLSSELHQEVLAVSHALFCRMGIPYMLHALRHPLSLGGQLQMWSQHDRMPDSTDLSHAPHSLQAGTGPRRHDDHCLHGDSECNQVHLSTQHLQVSGVSLGTFLMPLLDLWIFWAQLSTHSHLSRLRRP